MRNVRDHGVKDGPALYIVQARAMQAMETGASVDGVVVLRGFMRWDIAYFSDFCYIWGGASVLSHWRKKPNREG